MKVIGLTGGIGTGKSTVSQYLQDKGCAIVDADKIGHEITETGMPLLQSLAEAFGENIINGDGSLNRKLLASMAFASDEGRAKLNAITHKEIIRLINERVEKLKADNAATAVIIDAPLLYEAGLDSLTDMVWAVDATSSVRLARVALRDGMTEDEILQRIKHQMNSHEKNERADLVIDNSGSKEELYQRIDEAFVLYV